MSKPSSCRRPVEGFPDDGFRHGCRRPDGKMAWSLTQFVVQTPIACQGFIETGRCVSQESVLAGGFFPQMPEDLRRVAATDEFSRPILE